MTPALRSLLFLRSLTAKALFAFALLSLVLVALGAASFRYQESLFNPREFNEQLIRQTLFWVRLLERDEGRRAGRGRLRPGASAILLVPDDLKLKAGEDMEVIEDLSPRQRDFLHLLVKRINKRPAGRDRRQGLRQDRIQDRRRQGQEHTDPVNKNRTIARFVEVDDALIGRLAGIDRSEAAAFSALTPLNRAREGAGEGAREGIRDGNGPRHRHFLSGRRRAFTRALSRPVVLLQFETGKADTHRLLLLPAFTNRGFARLIVGLFLGTMALAALLTLYAIRSITRPLGHMTRSAKQFGRSLTPDPVTSRSGGEMGEAVGAFNAMQSRVKNLVDGRTRIIGAVSHDLRTHLTRIRLRMQIMADAPHGQTDTPALTRQYAEKTIRDLEEMESILESSLEYNRYANRGKADGGEPGGGKPNGGEPGGEPNGSAALARVDLHDLMTGLTSAFDPPIAYRTVSAGTSFNPGTSVNPGAAGHPEPLWVTADATALKRALNNILANAERHAEGTEASLEAVDGGALIRIQDLGPGIPAAERERVLEPFYRLENSRNRQTGGTGLGLAIAFEIITNHNGRLRLTDRPDGRPGLCVEIRLKTGPENGSENGSGPAS